MGGASIRTGDQYQGLPAYVSNSTFGGAIYYDGNTFGLSLCGTLVEENTANEGGGAVFFVSNDRSGKLIIDRSTVRQNPSGGFETPGFQCVFVLASGGSRVTDSTIEGIK